MEAKQIARRRRGPRGALEIRAGWQWPIVGVALPVAVPAALGLFVARGFEWWTALCLVVSIGWLWGTSFYRQWRWRKKGTLLEINAQGLSFLGGRNVPWADIATVRRTRKDNWEGVVFVARPGVVLPLLQILLFTRRSPERRAQVMIKRWGSQLVLVPIFLDTSAERIIEAVHVFGDSVPVHGGRPRDVSG